MKHNTLLLLLFFSIAQPLSSKASSQWLAPSDNLTHRHTLNFWTGYSFFKAPWVFAPSSTLARDGLGPLFNARACESCHINGRAGIMHLPHSSHDSLAHDFVIRIGSQAKKDPTASHYGGQLQTLSKKTLSAKNAPLPEADISIQWLPQSINITANALSLSKPILVINKDHYGKLPQALSYSIRLAPALYGLGLVDLLSNEVILNNADPEDKNNDGISGRGHKSWDIKNKKYTLGKFGHKSEQPNLEQQNATAFIEDIGISSSYYPTQNCTAIQTRCQNAPNGNSQKYQVEIIDAKLTLVTEFTQYLKAPKSQYNPPITPRSFIKSGCSSCHIPSLALPANNQFKQDRIYAYSDFLLHDLGPGLSDGRHWNNIHPNEWRTTPLWGLARKLQNNPISLLHDGRARSLKDAILWHGGEALPARNAFIALPETQQSIIINFLKQL